MSKAKPDPRWTALRKWHQKQAREWDKNGYTMWDRASFWAHKNSIKEMDRLSRQPRKATK